MFRNRGLAFKLSVYILFSTTVLFIAVFLFNHFITRNIILKNVKADAKNISYYNISRIETVLKSVETVVENYAHLFESFNFNEKEIHNILMTYVGKNDAIYGATIAFEPGVYSSKIGDFSPYYYKNADSLIFVDIARVEPNFRRGEWYSVPKEIGEPYWSEPYYDEGVGEILMTTFSVPFYIVKNGIRVFAGIVDADVSLEWLTAMVSSVKMFESGYALIVSKKGTFVTHPKEDYILKESVFSVAERLNSLQVKKYGEQMIIGETGFVRILGTLLDTPGWMFFTPMKSTNWTLAVMFPEDELYKDLNYLNQIILFIALVGFLLLFIIIVLISKRLTNPLEKLTIAAEGIGTGNLDIQLPKIKSNDEIGKLTKSMTEMETQLKHYIENLKSTTAAKEMIESELRIAQQIQLGMIPKLFPPYPDTPEIDLFAKLEPAKEVGGDMYDFFFIDDTHLCLAIGDVSGKGVPASLLMAVTRTLLRAKAVSGISSDELVNSIKKDFQDIHDSKMFVTFFLAIVDLSTGEMNYTSAGHNPPFLITAKKDFITLESETSLPLGVKIQKTYKSAKINLEAGDKIILYTDGITEAMNTNSDLFGEENLEKVLTSSADEDVKNIAEGIFSFVKTFAGEAEQYDDMTLVVFHFKKSLQK
jgi:sigma-B regulation protein RsbU (phosphoserine phosphatase)